MHQWFGYDRTMFDGPNITGIAALIGDHARATMLTALMSGEALTATELAAESGVTKQTASAHLSKLSEAGLIEVEAQGRHRYFRLADPDVARLLESLMGIAERTGARRVRPGPKDPELRRARVCYDHLAGDMGVELYDSFVERKLLKVTREDETSTVDVTPKGSKFLKSLGIEPASITTTRRPLCKACLDWSVRRHHLAGTLGATLLDYCYEKKWAKREAGTRVVKFTATGERNFRSALLG